jgi:plastocyanin
MSLLRPAVLAACVALVLGGCGDGDGSPVPPGTVVLDDYEFRPRDVQASRGETLTVVNEGGIAHNLTIERGSRRVAGTESFLNGDRERLRVDLPPGRYRMICTVPGHEDLGMTGTLTVR